MKWDKLDTKFLTYSLVISVIAIVIGLFFYPYQINENYLHISLNEEAAKYKAEQYIGSRGWDISGYTFSCKYSQNYNDQNRHGRNSWLNQNYIKENITDKNKVTIKEIDRLTGANRWNMRWYQPPNTDEIKISYTKDGDLTYFSHIIPDSLAGDTLPEEIANNIAIMFLKDMTNTNWQEDDWELKNKELHKQQNRLDYYFEWENTKYKFDESTVRMSINVKGSQVTDYNRWLENPESTEKQVEAWASDIRLFNLIGTLFYWSIVIFSILFTLFYHNIPTNWTVAFKYTLFVFILRLLNNSFEISYLIYDYWSEDTFLSSLSETLMSSFTNSIWGAFTLLFLFAACEKLYRKNFPNFISIKNLFNPKGYTSKRYSNNYTIGIVFASCTFAFIPIFYFAVQSSGNYIAYDYLNLSFMLTSSPWLYLFSTYLVESFRLVFPYVLLAQLVYHFIPSKSTTIILSAIIFAFVGGGTIFQLIDVDPIFINVIYYLIIGMISGYILFNYGILSLLVYHFCLPMFALSFKYFYTGQVNYITTGAILILLLLSPTLYSIIAYIKHRTTTNIKPLLNSAENIIEKEIVDPPASKILPLKPIYHKWGLLLVIIGICCLFIPIDNNLKNMFSFSVSNSDAIEEAQNIIENNYNEDLSDFSSTSTTTYFNHISDNTGFNVGPFRLIQMAWGRPLYLIYKTGRNGAIELIDKYHIALKAWFITFYKTNDIENYSIAIDSRNKKNIIFYDHTISDTLTIASVEHSEAEKILRNGIKNQHLDISNLPIETTYETDLDVRIDHSISFKRNLILDDQSVVDQIISTKLSGNKLSNYQPYFDTPEEWRREYFEYDFISLLCMWVCLIIFIAMLIYCIVYLIKDVYVKRLQISWNWIRFNLFLIFFISIVYFINTIPILIFEAIHYHKIFLSETSWIEYWLQRGLNSTLNIPILSFLLIFPICCVYFINPLVKSIFTKESRRDYGRDALTSSLATLGAFLLYRPIKFLLNASFSDYLNLNSTIYTNQDFSQYLPGFGLLITIIIETLFLFSFSLFLYHRFTEYSNQGKGLKKILIITAVAIFYVFYDVLLQHTDIAMIPHYISRISGLIMFLFLVKYFWKNNPLSHLFGLIIYFQLDKIINFIQLADQTLKSQGWIVAILLLVLFIYSVGIETVRSRFSSKTT